MVASCRNRGMPLSLSYDPNSGWIQVRRKLSFSKKTAPLTSSMKILTGKIYQLRAEAVITSSSEESSPSYQDSVNFKPSFPKKSFTEAQPKTSTLSVSKISSNTSMFCFMSTQL
jgi:hypothetical protein